jgi:hypothetical protein
MRGRRAEAGEGQPAWKPGGDPLPDSTVSHYRILGLLGRGGMGVVYRARDEQSGHEVALKLLAVDRVRGGDGDRFRREARAAASLDHPNIAKVLEIGEHQGYPFLAMPLYEGETLKKRLDRAEEIAPMPIAEIVSVAAQLASALETAHSAGIVHRDLKPANLMLTRGGRLKLLDFGLALWEGSSRLTDTGQAVGTLAFMAPEQLRGEEVDARADLWSFGAVLYEMLAGSPPFVKRSHESLQDLMQMILEREPPPIREARPDTPPVLARIIERCLRKDPAARFATAGEIVDELRAAALLTDPHPRPDREAEGLLLWLLLAAGVLLVLVLAAALRLTRGAPDAIQVRVLAPEVQGLPPGETSRMTSGLEQALRQALREIDGVTLREPPHPAEEEVAASAYCGPHVCEVILRRLDAKDGSELWTERAQAPPARPVDLAVEMEALLRRAYPSSR